MSPEQARAVASAVIAGAGPPSAGSRARFYVYRFSHTPHNASHKSCSGVLNYCFASRCPGCAPAAALAGRAALEKNSEPRTRPFAARPAAGASRVSRAGLSASVRAAPRPAPAPAAAASAPPAPPSLVAFGSGGAHGVVRSSCAGRGGAKCGACCWVRQRGVPKCEGDVHELVVVGVVEGVVGADRLARLEGELACGRREGDRKGREGRWAVWKDATDLAGGPPRPPPPALPGRVELSPPPCAAREGTGARSPLMGGEEGGGGGGGGVARRCRAAPGARAWVWRGGRGSRVALRRARLPASTAGARGHEHCGKIRGDTGRYGEIWPRSRALWRAASARVRCRRAKREVGGCVGGGPDWLSAISAGPRRLGSIWTRSRLDLGYLSARISPSSRRACEAPAGDRGTSPAPEVARGEPRRGRGEPTAPDLGQSQRSRPISRLHPLVMHLDVHLPRLRKMSHAPVATHEPTPLPPLPSPVA